MFHSGQGYNPILKKLSQKTGINQLRLMGSLPAMVTNLLLPDEIYKSSKEEKEAINALIRELRDVSMTMKDEIEITEGNNCIRLEFYFSSKFKNATKDWSIPNLPVWSFTSISDQCSYFNALSKSASEIVGPLCTTFVDHPHTQELDYRSLPLSSKRMLILCTELAVSMAEFFPFHPKTLQEASSAADSSVKW